MKKIIIVSYEGRSASDAIIEQIARQLLPCVNGIESLKIAQLDEKELLDHLVGSNITTHIQYAKTDTEAVKNAAIYIGTLFEPTLSRQDITAFSILLTRELLVSNPDSRLKNAVEILAENKVPQNIARTYNLTKEVIDIIKNVLNVYRLGYDTFRKD